MKAWGVSKTSHISSHTFGRDEKARGAVFTKPAVVDFMLDLIGYTSDKPLHQMRLLEPSFGAGRFVLYAVDRLVQAWTQQDDRNIQNLQNALLAIEVDRDTYRAFSVVLKQHLLTLGFTPPEAEELCASWLRCEDFLLGKALEPFDFVIGNPPYVRPELIPKNLLQQYRATYRTMTGRADLYIAFMERCLDLLNDGGKLSFICADAWTRNQYGSKIRSKIARDFSLSHYVDLYGLNPFEVPVRAYPSITVVTRHSLNPTCVIKAESVEESYLQRLCSELLVEAPESHSHSFYDIKQNDGPWLLSPNSQVKVLREIESRIPTLGEAGCRVGIGVATGADKIYIAPFEDLDVEDDRKLPLATRKDIAKCSIAWSGNGVINPWHEEGGLVDLDKYPKLAAYLKPHRFQLSKRHTAKSDITRKWYKTIDRITPSLLREPKLLIPDIKSNGDNIAYDPGTLYPHHNLYYITSAYWNIRALQALLRSGIAQLFVSAYSVKIGGGYLRFQAQNLRRIRVPFWHDIHEDDRIEMQYAGESNRKLSTELLERVYRLEAGTLSFLETNTNGNRTTEF